MGNCLMSELDMVGAKLLCLLYRPLQQSFSEVGVVRQQATVIYEGKGNKKAAEQQAGKKYHREHAANAFLLVPRGKVNRLMSEYALDDAPPSEQVIAGGAGVRFDVGVPLGFVR